MQVLLAKHWHHLPINEVVAVLETDLDRGLDLFDIKHRQERFGPNILTARRGKSPLLRFLLQFNNPLIYILLVATVVTAVFKDLTDAVIILAVVLVNAIIGFVQESKAERAIEALAQAMTSEATVQRSGQTVRIAASELVPGDVVWLKAGDKVPADMRLVRSRDLQVAESALTGESVPVEKAADVHLGADVVLAERRNMVYASTLVTYGQGLGVVTSIGDNTEVGRISQLISQAEELTTPLTLKIEHFSRILLYAIVALAAFAFLVGLMRGQAWLDTLSAAIALAVAMIPEGLPAALTVTLAIGVSRMARRHAIIRKLPAVETLGSVTVICSDKTGTLTQNQMTVQQIAVLDACYEVTGSGYAPTGEILGSDGQAVTLDHSPALSEILIAGLLCNDSQLIEESGTWKAQGDPTEVALIVSAYKAGLTPDSRLNLALPPRLDAIPFESQHQYMATLHDLGPDQPRVAYTKGAAEVLLDKCGGALDAAGEEVSCRAEELHHMADAMSQRGLRVLAFARKQFPADTTAITHDDLADDLTLVGLQGMLDPPRPEAMAAIRTCQSAGIRVKMITGDHALTAVAIGQQLGLGGAAADPEAPAALTGRTLTSYSDAQLIEAAERTDVFARVSPEQKLRLVEALQARGHVVAMTGDGVNDGPALKQSNVGIAMGIAGTEVAKEAADMILTDDNFATIEAAVEEGRGVFDNLTKIIAWTLPTNLGEGMIILLALMLGVILPILPIHILWINMTTTAVLGLALAVELREPNIMKRPPRVPDSPILSSQIMIRILIVGTLILIGAFGLYEWELSRGAGVAAARTVVVNAVIAIEVFYLFNCRSLTQSIFRLGVLSNRWMVVGIGAMALLQVLFTYVPAMNRFLTSAPIDLAAWGRILAVGLGSYLIIEFEKWLRRRPKQS
ncbi:MAG: cation-transporting P-type ATPase [Anaerolineae bacterium]|nr:cation-transporting P-type ATPase [Anaerolineae bacterium]